MLIIPVALAGLMLGWFASVLFRTRYYHAVVINLVVGVAGALISGQLFAPVMRRPPIVSSDISLGTFAISLAGAAVVLAVVELIRRAGTR